MSTCNAPINIDPAAVTAPCSLKCALALAYNTSTGSVATHRGEYLSLTYDRSGGAPVSFNLVDQFVTEMRIYRPSLHTYAGQHMDAEVIVVHNSDKGTRPVYLFVPVRAVSSSSSAGAGALATIVDSVAKGAPDEGGSTQIPSFTLADIVPMKPFFTYTGSMPFQPCTVDAQVQYAVWDANNACDMLSDTFDSLKKLISTHSIAVAAPRPLFYNDRGPSSSVATGGADDLFIDCQPVLESTQTVTTSSTSSAPPFKLSDFTKSPFFIVVVATLGFVAIIWLLSMFYHRLANYGASAGDAVGKAVSKVAASSSKS